MRTLPMRSFNPAPWGQIRTALSLRGARTTETRTLLSFAVIAPMAAFWNRLPSTAKRLQSFTVFELASDIGAEVYRVQVQRKDA